MPPELASDGVMLESYHPGPAGIAATRSRRFLTLSLFQFKRCAAPLQGHHQRASAQQPDHDQSASAQHHRSASIDSSATCLGGGTSHWQHKFRDALLCEQPMSSSSPCHQPDDQTEQSVREPQQQSCSSLDESGRKVSRWWRIVGRFGGKNRVREETAQPNDQKKARVTHCGSISDIRKQVVVVEEPRCGSTVRGEQSKWVSCEDLSRIARKENSRTHNELVEPVLEPMRIVSSDSAQCPEERNASDDVGLSQTRKKLRFRCSGFDSGGLGLNQECRNVVTHLRSKAGKEQGVVAAEARLLAKDFPSARATLASLGAVAPLISMLDSPSTFCAHSALLTLYTLAVGNDLNKAAIVDSGVIPKLLNLLQKREPSILEAVVANFLSLSALDRNKPLIGSAGAIPQLIKTLNQRQDEPIRRDSLRALYNLSLSTSNIKFFVAGDAATAVMAILKSQNVNVGAENLKSLDRDANVSAENLKTLGDVNENHVSAENLKTRDRDMYANANESAENLNTRDVIPNVNDIAENLQTQERDANASAEKALAVLGNMACVGIGRKCIAETAQSLETLIEVLGWNPTRSPKCQERAAYILMVIAHHSYVHRQAMVQKRAIPALLEVSLLGTPLAQKRAVRVLECLREDREQGPRAVSAPMGAPPRTPRHNVYSLPRAEQLRHHGDVGGAGSQASQVVNHMVQQSLEQNLQRIVRRANVPLSLSGCSSSKSLPF